MGLIILLSIRATPATGILDSMTSDVRFGLFQYNSGSGGHITDYVDYSGIGGMVGTISNMLGSTSTPLGETLYEAVRYFRQESTYYSSSDYIKGCTGATSGTSTCAAGATPTANDPYYFVFSDPSIPHRYVPCAKSYIIVMTDGEPTSDTSMPGTATLCALLRLHPYEYKSVFRLWRSSHQPQPQIRRHPDRADLFR